MHDKNKNSHASTLPSVSAAKDDQLDGWTTAQKFHAFVSYFRQRGVRGCLRDILKATLRPLVFNMLKFFEAHPKMRLRYTGVGGEQGIYDRVVFFYQKISPQSKLSSVSILSKSGYKQQELGYAPVLTQVQFNPNAQMIYARMQSAIQRNQSEKDADSH